MGVILAFVAGLFTSLTNLCARKGVDVGGNAKGFFACQMLATAVFSLMLGPLRRGDCSIPLYPALMGVLAGLLLSVMLFSLGCAVEKGPPGFTFAILNSATVTPGFLMALLFGAANGFLYNYWHAIGSFLVLLGLFWGAKGIQGIQEKKIWAISALLMFLFHSLLLCLYQCRAMLMKQPESAHFASEWFTPFMFCTCACIQFSIYLYSQRKSPRKGEVLLGCAGGLCTLLCTFFLLLAAEKANPLENAVIFPMFSIVGIILTNLWSQNLYDEQINWKACQLSALGLFIGTVDWKALF